MGKPTQPFAFPVEYLKEILRYNSRTGEFFWKITQGKAKKGFRAGYKRRSRTKEGYKGRWYWSIYIYDLELHKTFQYQAHRLAWYMFYGEDPFPYNIDHKDKDSLNNKIRNLRKVTTAENNKNKSKYKNNSTGYPGIYLTYEGKFRATAYIDGKSVNAGTWETIEDAVKARNDLRGKIHG